MPANCAVIASLCRRTAKRQHLAAALGLLQKVGPVLHHLGARLQVERVVVGCADGVARRVGKLQFDVLMRVTLLMQEVEATPRKPCPVMRPL